MHDQSCGCLKTHSCYSRIAIIIHHFLLEQFARMDDDWREDGSLRGSHAAAGAQKKARSKGKGPQFTRVIPTFLQKYHQAPAIQAKFATLPKAGEEEEVLLEARGGWCWCVGAGGGGGGL